MFESPGLFVEEGGHLVPTPWCRGPWDHGAMHGGAITGLVGWAAESAVPSARMVLTRMTVELWHLVPIQPLTVVAEVARPGRRVTVVDVEIRHDDRLLVRASTHWALPQFEQRGLNDGNPALMGRGGDGGPYPPSVLSEGPALAGSDARLDVDGLGAVPPRPALAVDPSLGDFDYPRPGFNCDAAELRPVMGSTEDPGPGVVWARVRQPVVVGHPLTPLQRVATLSDLGAAVGWDWSPTGAAFINPDVTMQLKRYPIGEWVCLDSRTSADSTGIGFCETILWDDDGQFGRVLQTQVESPHSLRIEASARHP